jgi:hypothetical protein
VIVCSCAVISDAEIEQALVEILSLPDAPLPTPGVVYRHLQKKMVCCGCAPLAVSTIYQKIDDLARKGLACPYACESAQGRLLERVRDTHALRLVESTRGRSERRCSAAAHAAAPPEAPSAA